MDINIKVLVSIIGGALVLILIWLFFVMSTNKNLKREVSDWEEKFEMLDGFNEVLLYELDTSRDSVRLLQQRIIELEK